MTTSTQRFTCGLSAVDVHADDVTLAELVELTHPFFSVVDPASASASAPSPSVLVAEQLPDGPSWTRVSYPSEFEPERVLWVDHERRAVAVVSTPSDWRTQQALRCIRNIIRWQAYARGELFVHGGLVSVEGAGIAFLGHKRAGKTSSILSALVHAEADFVSNDDLVLVGGDGQVTGYGYPRTVNVRTDSLLALTGARPELARLLRTVSHPANTYPGKQLDEVVGVTEDGTAVPESLWVRCAELAEVTGAKMRARHAVHVVAFPEFVAPGEPVGVDALTPTESALRLAAHTESGAVDFDPFLADWFPSDTTGGRLRIVEQLLATARFVRVRQHLDRMAESTEALRAALHGARTTGVR